MAGLIRIGEAAAIASIVGAPERLRMGLRDAAYGVGGMLDRRVRQYMRDGPQNGHHYPNLRRQSSAPGEFPAIQSSQLLNSIGYTVTGAERLEFGSRGAFNQGYDYAVGLHEGTSKMGARPYLTMTVDRNRTAIHRALGEVTWRKIIGGGG